MLFPNFFSPVVPMETNSKQTLTRSEKIRFYFQSKGLSRDYIKTIKQQRRTMKNRGYAAACR